MPMSATGKMNNNKGFTLIELLVVLVIISVLTSLIALSFTPNQSSPQRETQRFYQVLEADRQEAVLFNQDLGVEVRGNAYQVLQWRAQQWQPADTPLFSEYQLPENLDQTLWINGLANENNPGDNDDPQPQILLFATGEVTPFEWSLKDPAENDQWRLSANPLGDYELKMEPLR